MSIDISDEEKLYPVGSLIEAYTGISPSDQTVSRISKNGEINASKVLGRWMCRKKDFLAYSEASTTEALNMPKRKTTGLATKTRSEKARARALEIAEKDLAEAGI